MRIYERNNSDAKFSKKGRGCGVPGAGADVPLQSVANTMASQAVPLQPIEANGVGILLQPVEDHTPEQVDSHRGL